MCDAPKYRFFAEDLSGDAIELPDDEARHARGVLRLTGGETVEVFDGAGGAVVGTFILESAKQQGGTRKQRSFQPTDPGSFDPAPNGPRRKAAVGASVQVIERRQVARPEPAIELAFAVPKGNRLDWLLEKAAELGAARLTPVAFERSVVRPDLSEHARQRWRGILIAACKQCGSDWLPEIAAPAALAEYLAGAMNGIRLLGDAREGVSVPEVLGGTDKRRPLVRGCAVQHGHADAASRRAGIPPIRILVGPEGGLTDAERSGAIAAGFVPVRLGRTVLRMETAAMALLAAVIAWAGVSRDS